MIDLLTQNILTLNKTDQAQVFRMLSDNADVLIKVIPNAPLLVSIISGMPVDDSPIIQAYTAWKHSL